MTRNRPELGDDVSVPDVVGLAMQAAREAGFYSGVTITPPDPGDSPPGAPAWDETSVVTAQRPGAGVRIRRWGPVAVSFDPRPPGGGDDGGGEAGDREPRHPRPPLGTLHAEADEPDPELPFR
ncbi:hypothetical protein [Actinospica robiniae]|uniref:hypothetical protein n=1 Tax=Actinospica robiniae TaxID=304901 RepID=UPI000416D070|nr:hypothetical protein [Actinospica robiniae]